MPLSGEPQEYYQDRKVRGLNYIDEEGAYYQSEAQRPASMLMTDNRPGEDVEMRGLVRGAADMGGLEEGDKVRFQKFNDSPNLHPSVPSTKSSRFSEPGSLYSLLLFPTGLDRLLALFGVKAGKFPIEQAIERKRRGIGGQRYPIAAWILTVGEFQLAATLSDELIKLTRLHSHDCLDDIRAYSQQQCHGITNRYQTTIQLHDWPIVRSPHQHRRAIRAVSKVNKPRTRTLTRVETDA